MLAAELSARDEDESVIRRELESCAGDGFLIDNRLKLVAGELDRLLNELAVSERRDAWSANRSLRAAVGSANEAARTVRSLTGEVFWSSIIFGRPAETKDTTTAKSQLLPFSNLDMDIFLAEHTTCSSKSWMLSSSESGSMGDKSSSEER